MEAAAPSKNYARNMKKSINRTFSATPCENLAPFNCQNGIIQTPPPPFLYHSFPPFLANKQPPLLPLPISNGVQHYNNITTLPLNRGFSCPPINRKANKNGKSKKFKSFTSSPKKEENSKSSNVVMISSTNPLGPNTKHLPRDVPLVFSMSSTGKKEEPFDALNSHNLENPKKDSTTLDLLDKVNKFSSSMVSTISPPPSSLPLPTFPLRPKLSCNAEAAAGVDAGATDNLRRLLRLR